MPRLNTTSFLGCTLCLVTTLALSGCGGSNTPSTTGGNNNGATAAAPLPDGMLLSEKPDGVQAITALKESASEGDEVVVRVIVGGRMHPMVEGRASMAIIDATIDNPCLDEDDHCQTPWDYCCTPPEDITANLATLQVLDADGRVLAADLAGQIEPLTTLVVRGVVGPRPDPQVLTINATGIYIESDPS